MRYFEIALPTVTNDGKEYSDALQRWEGCALAIAGGFTRRPDGDGHWRDPDTGRVFVDRMRSYRVACDAKEFARLLGIAFDLFPDQLAIFTAEIGEATIHNRPGG